MEFSIAEYFIIIVGSFLAGCINTLAGSGSAIALAILTEVMGLPGTLANGTNRVGVIAQGGLSSYVFYKNDKLDIKGSLPIILLIFVGALIGVYVATQISNDQFRTVFKFLMIAMLFIIVIRPKRWLIQSDVQAVKPTLLTAPLFLALGFYGGFIQMGMGVFCLALFVLVSKYDIIKANALKVFAVAFYTIFVIAIFQYKGLIDWKAGSLLAIGQMIGGYFTAIFASKYVSADVWAYRLLIVIIIIVILRLFGVFG